MVKKVFLVWLIGSLLVVLMVVGVGKSGSFAAEKLKYAVPFRLSPIHFLPPLAAEEKGFWKQQGLDVEFVPFKKGSAMMQAVAAGAVDFGVRPFMSTTRAISRGMPVIMVASTGRVEYFSIYVSTGSRLKEAKDLKGAKIGIGRYGGITDAFAHMLVRALGLEKDVRFVASGGTRAEIAALKAGHIDGLIAAPLGMVRFKFAGKIQEIKGTNIKEHLPKDWISDSLFSTVELTNRRPQAIRGMIKGFFQATSFIQKDHGWSIAKMKSYIGYSDALANHVYPLVNWERGGKIDNKAARNVIEFVVKYKIMPRGKIAPLSKLFTNRFVE